MDTYEIEASLNDVVVIKQDEAEQTNKGFLIAAENREAPWRGTIVAMGEDVESKQNLKIKVGDKVYFKMYAGHPINVDGEEFMLVPYEDVLVKVVLKKN